MKKLYKKEKPSAEEITQITEATNGAIEQKITTTQKRIFAIWAAFLVLFVTGIMFFTACKTNEKTGNPAEKSTTTTAVTTANLNPNQPGGANPNATTTTASTITKSTTTTTAITQETTKKAETTTTVTTAKQTQPTTTKAPQTTQKQTTQKPTPTEQTQPPQTEPPQTQPPQTQPAQTEPPSPSVSFDEDMYNNILKPYAESIGYDWFYVGINDGSDYRLSACSLGSGYGLAVWSEPKDGWRLGYWGIMDANSTYHHCTADQAFKNADQAKAKLKEVAIEYGFYNGN